MNPYCAVKTAAPLFNDPDLSKFFGPELALDSSGLLRCVETILFPGSKVKVSRETPFSYIVEVTTLEYPYPGSYYMDKRFLTEVDESYPERIKTLPSAEAILKEMKSYAGALYIWGGNAPYGIPELLEWYPPSSSLVEQKRAQWMLQGFDCSGLLYHVTQGILPRNTSSLIHYGNPVDIEGLTLEEVALLLRPLDLIVWKGHVICMMEEGLSIESSLEKGGVVICDVLTRLKELKRKPVNTPQEEGFVVRRWQ